MAVGRARDLFVSISTSGNSRDIISAIETARDMGIATIALIGEGGKIKDLAGCAIAVPSCNTPRVQEVHIRSAHPVRTLENALS